MAKMTKIVNNDKNDQNGLKEQNGKKITKMSEMV